MQQSRFMNRHGWMVSLMTLLLLVVAATVAKADALPKPDDEIVLQLSERTWVKADKARVMVSIDTAMDAKASKDLRKDVAQALSGLAKAVEWQLTGFHRQPDKAGLERWRINAEARLSQSELAGLEGRAKDVSRAGLQVRVSQVNFSPSPEEMEAARKALRKTLYARVVEELDLVNSVMGDRKFRVGRIDFMNMGMPIAQPRLYAQKANMEMMADSMPVQATAMNTAMNTGRELHQRVTVSLLATAP